MTSAQQDERLLIGASRLYAEVLQAPMEGCAPSSRPTGRALCGCRRAGGEQRTARAVFRFHRARRPPGRRNPPAAGGLHPTCWWTFLGCAAIWCAAAAMGGTGGLGRIGGIPASVLRKDEVEARAGLAALETEPHA